MINIQFLSFGIRLVTILTAVFLLTMLVPFYAALADEPEEPQTMTFELEKNFSGDIPEGVTADQFSFNVEGIGEVALSYVSDGVAVATVELEVGTYSLSENIPAGYTVDDWSVQWSGAGCQNTQADTTSITVDASDLDKTNFGCRADNTYIGVAEPTTVDLELTKAISGETLGFLLSDFSYQVTGGDIDTTVAHGDTVALPIGTYVIEELVPASFVKEDWRIGWYGQCEAGAAFTTTITIDESNVDHGTLYCQADNQYRPDSYDEDVYGCTDSEATNYNPEATINDESCEYDSTEPMYLVYGYVWHDANENDEWDGFGQEEPETLEDDLTAWTVEITNGETTFSTTSDELGYYEFYVPAGTWTISEILQENWTQTFPNEVTHVVVVGSFTQAGTSFLAALVEAVIPTAHAQSPTSYGPFNFGNFFTGGSDGGDGGDGGNGGDDGGGNNNSNPSSGGGSPAPRCQEFTAEIVNAEVVLQWDTSRGTEMMIGADGVEVYSTTNNNETSEGTITLAYGGETAYELTVSRGNRSDTCTAEFDFGTGGGQVLGDQVSVVPVGAPDAGAGGAAPLHIPAASPMVAALLRRNE